MAGGGSSSSFFCPFTWWTYRSLKSDHCRGRKVLLGPVTSGTQGRAGRRRRHSQRCQCSRLELRHRPARPASLLCLFDFLLCIISWLVGWTSSQRGFRAQQGRLVHQEDELWAVLLQLSGLKTACSSTSFSEDSCLVPQLCRSFSLWKRGVSIISQGQGRRMTRPLPQPESYSTGPILSVASWPKPCFLFVLLLSLIHI